MLHTLRWHNESELVSVLAVLFNLPLLFFSFFNLTRVPLQNVDLRGCWKVFQPQITRPIMCILSLWFGLGFFLLSHSSYEEAMRNQSSVILTCTDAVLLPLSVSSWAHRLAAQLPRPAAFCPTHAENHFHWLQVFPLELQADTDVFPTNNPSRFHGFCPFHPAETTAPSSTSHNTVFSFRNPIYAAVQTVWRILITYGLIDRLWWNKSWRWWYYWSSECLYCSMSRK